MKKSFMLFLLAILLRNSTSVLGEQPQLHICTIATDSAQGLNQLLDSCQYHDISIEVLGDGIPVKGLAEKLILVRNYIKNLPATDVVMFVEGGNALILADSDTILDQFLQSNHPFIVSGERYCWPLTNRQEEFPDNSSSFRYVNSGVYIGYVCAIQSVFNSFPSIHPQDNDQGLLSAYYLENPGTIQIDKDCQFFLTMPGVIQGELELDYANKQVRIHGITPFAVHGNGGSRPLYQYVYDQLFNDEGAEMPE